MTTDRDALYTRLAALLPRRRFRFYHVSTPPLEVDALCSAPPGERPDRTFCEKHFLGITIHAPSREQQQRPLNNDVLVLGIEIYIYTSAYETTIFISKADSTGFLSLLDLPRGAPSPVREISAAWIRHLVDSRRRQTIPLVVSLFARAQGQYLFPGSVEHGGKHVLDDRGLVRWWCRVLDPLVADTNGTSDDAGRGYLLVPGLDKYETRAFLPSSPHRWRLGHPLQTLSHYSRDFDWVPPRCLIPHFPDDPKSRFQDELDDEALRSGAMKTTGSWKSVHTLDVFWEMMAFRQECSSGRLTGFIWVVFGLPDVPTPRPQTPAKIQSTATPQTTPRKLRPEKESENMDDKEKKPFQANTETRRKKSRRKVLTGPIVTRQPRIKTQRRNRLLDRPETTKYYHWPVLGRGERIVDESGYRRILELLLHLDFATLDKAVGSTARWVGEASMSNPWGIEIIGTRDVATEAADQEIPVNNLSGLIKRKRADKSEAQVGQARSTVNILDTGLVRKKSKA
ncbi:hypothetical protein CDD81_7971 [Ophiocordyceps australis]|uniref:histone acetyltransferase n=1 Tax=Ophiocordyceps australis TaxID=1399860 RepID=A0A2C5XZE4_9HYPO|nr:hypothetical protein CDD81_7971 [Ophiocordyceps australis]